MNNHLFRQRGASGMSDPLGWIKRLWGSMQVPGMVTPPMSLDELDQKIQDLKTVESWLNVNMSMLRGTIQTLEVQRATLSALQSLRKILCSRRRMCRKVLRQPLPVPPVPAAAAGLCHSLQSKEQHGQS
jgi:hypothetical protein